MKLEIDNKLRQHRISVSNVYKTETEYYLVIGEVDSVYYCLVYDIGGRFRRTACIDPQKFGATDYVGASNVDFNKLVITVS